MFDDKFIMRTTVFALAAALVMGTAGCGQKTVDYSVDDGTSKGDEANSGDSAGGLAGKLGIPESCDETFDVGDSGESAISCKTDEISVPDADSMKTVYYETNVYDAATVQRITESLLDKEEGIYVREDDVRTKDEVQQDIDFYEEQKEIAAENGEDENVTYYEQEIENLQKDLTSAVDSLPAVTSYGETGEYYGTKDGHGYRVSFAYDSSDGSGDANETGTGFSYTETNTEIQKQLAEVEGATMTYFTAESGDLDVDVDELENVCEISEDEALSTAMNLLADMGMTGMTATMTTPLVQEWDKEESTGEQVPLKVEANGYAFYFVRQIDGANIADACVSNAENFSSGVISEGDTSFYMTTAADYMCVYVNDDGIVQAYGTVYVDSSSLTEGDDVELLSWDEMLAAANESIAEYYTKYPTQYSELKFNYLSLCYIASVDDSGKKCFIPAWEFKECAGLTGGVDDRYNVEQVVYIDARDGSCIDVVDAAKKLGTYFTW